MPQAWTLGAAFGPLLGGMLTQLVGFRRAASALGVMVILAPLPIMMLPLLRCCGIARRAGFEEALLPRPIAPTASGDLRVDEPAVEPLWCRACTYSTTPVAVLGPQASTRN